MKIEFVIPTYNRPAHLAALLWCLKAQTSPDWTAHVVSDCSPTGTLDNIKAMFANEPRIRFTDLDFRHNDFGHTPRNVGLMTSMEDLVCMTGEDNYYMPVFVEEVLRSFSDERVNIAFTDFIHNWGKLYTYIQSNLSWTHCDIGNVIYRTKYASQLRLDPTNFSADWLFTDLYIKTFAGYAHHIQKVLYVHN